MKKVIKGKLYDTEKAREVAHWSNISNVTDFHWFCETLYRKRTGEYFVHGEGNAMSPYAESCGQSQWMGGERITPLSYEAARTWMEEHADADEYEAEFGIPDEDGEHDLHVIIGETAYQRIARAATTEGTTVRAIIERLAESL